MRNYNCYIWIFSKSLYLDIFQVNHRNTLQTLAILLLTLMRQFWFAACSYASAYPIGGVGGIMFLCCVSMHSTTDLPLISGFVMLLGRGNRGTVNCRLWDRTFLAWEHNSESRSVLHGRGARGWRRRRWGICCFLYYSWNLIIYSTLLRLVCATYELSLSLHVCNK